MAAMRCVCLRRSPLAPDHPRSTRDGTSRRGTGDVGPSYPKGRVLRRPRTSVPGATAVHTILDAIPRAIRLRRSPFGRSTRGYDADKNVNGRKRHIVVDTIGLLPGGRGHGAHVLRR